MSGTGSLQDLYRRTVLEHSRTPRNFRRPGAPDRHAEGHNPLCGDKVTVYLSLQDHTLSDVAFEASGCAISLASASMMTEAVRGKPEAAARGLIGDVVQMLGSPAAPAVEGDLAALQGVRDYPSRVRCATLPWQTLRAALDASQNPISTE